MRSRWLARAAKELAPASWLLAASLLWVPLHPRTQPGHFSFLNPATTASGMGALGGSQNDLHFINYRIGVVIGYDGMYRTDDGGLTWRKLPLPEVVSDDGKSIEYGSAADLLARIRTIEAEMASAAGRPKPRRSFAAFSKG